MAGRRQEMSRQGWLREHSIIIARAYTKQGVGGREVIE